jgi:outer membrane biosynthesis protein TonB
MIERVRQALRRKPPVGVAVSLLVHAALLLALISVHPARTPLPKRGDALIVELPTLPEPANAGTPGPQADAPAAPAPPARALPARPAPPARPTPPAPPRPPAAARPSPTPRNEPREAPRAVASAPIPPPAAEREDVASARSAPQNVPEPPRAEAARPAPTPEPPAPPAVASVPAPPGQVAMVPPPAPDIRSAFRRGGGGAGTGIGGAGGTAVGRGGIVGEPVPLDSKDAELSDYLERIKRLIKQNWVFPCVKDRDTGICEYKSTELLVEFGILKQGPLQYIEVRRASPWPIYDEFAVNAVKLASPFPPVPAAMMARMARGSAGAAIVARFVYLYDTGITNVLR